MFASIRDADPLQGKSKNRGEKREKGGQKEKENGDKKEEGLTPSLIEPLHRNKKPPVKEERANLGNPVGYSIYSGL